MSLNREKLLQKFNEEYNRLNEEQRRAVDHIEGPVMVIAGPGTGKTQILSARVGKILLETDVFPENILCLTYTDAGVIAMRKRLQNFIGPDAYKVNIYTFHAFCNDVIQENLSLFEKTSLDPISDLEEIELFQKLIDQFPQNHPLKRYRGDVYYEIHKLRELFSTMKREGWTPEFITQRIDDYIKGFPNRQEFYAKKAWGKYKKGDYRDDWAQEAKEETEKLRAAVNEFSKFQQMMRDANRYNFDDMINWVIRAFNENKNLLLRYQEQFQYILVDEYQDTSGTQNALVELLISYWDKPNVFVVGDDDQSIFRFQGANIENMESFANTYKDVLLKVVLKNNYRSTQPILDISTALIGRNKERLINKMEGLEKKLISSKDAFKNITHLPVVKVYETHRDEMIDITYNVEKLINEGIPPGRIAIIYKENKYGDDLAQYFKLKKIPVFSKRSLNLLKIPLAEKLVTFLKFLEAEHDIPYGGDEMLFEILHFDWFGIPAIEIAKLSVEVAELQFTDHKTSLRRRLHEKATNPPRDLFSQGLNPAMVKASRTIESLISAVPNYTLQNLFEKIIREAGVLQSIMQSDDRIWQLQVLTGLFDFLKEETRRKPDMKLNDLIHLFSLMQKEKLVLPLIQISGNERGVNLLTAHGAKGLEFEYVFFCGCNKGLWEGKKLPNKNYKIPDTLFSSAPVTSKEEELRRLFYVALTRAEQYLFISYTCFKNDGKEWEPSMYLAEIRDQVELPLEHVKIPEELQAQFQTLQFEKYAQPEIEKAEEEFISRLLDKFVMNVTALSNYLNCPLEFYFRNLVRIPSPRNEATEFGSSIHYALEQLFKKMLDKEPKVFPPLEEFLKDFDWFMHRHRESFTEEQFKRRLEYGHKVLTEYYNQYINTWNKIVVIERTIRNVVVAGVPLKGKLDKLEFNGKDVNVVDYKTGDPDKGIGKLKGPSDKNPNGGDYWRQAVFYKLLVDHHEARGWKAVSTEFDFIEPDKKKEYKKKKVIITPEDMEEVTKQIVTVWQRIQERDFYTGCGKEDCHWCRFVKTNNLAVAMHEIGAPEDEEDS